MIVMVASGRRARPALPMMRGMKEPSTFVALGCSGDLVSRRSSWPYGAYYGMLFGLIWDTKWTYYVN